MGIYLGISIFVFGLFLIDVYTKIQKQKDELKGTDRNMCRLYEDVAKVTDELLTLKTELKDVYDELFSETEAGEEVNIGERVRINGDLIKALYNKFNLDVKVDCCKVQAVKK